MLEAEAAAAEAAMEAEVLALEESREARFARDAERDAVGGCYYGSSDEDSGGEWWR